MAFMTFVQSPVRIGQPLDLNDTSTRHPNETVFSGLGEREYRDEFTAWIDALEFEHDRCLDERYRAWLAGMSGERI